MGAFKLEYGMIRGMILDLWFLFKSNGSSHNMIMYYLENNDDML